MEDPYNDIVFFEELPSERRNAVREAIRNDAELARTFAQWRQIRAALRAQIDTDLPDRRLLVLYALEEAGEGDVLSADEHAELSRARSTIERAIAAHPGLENAVARIQDDQEAFDTAWSAQYAEQHQTVPATARREADRAAQSPRIRQERAPVWQWAWRMAAFATVALVAVVGVWLLTGDEAQTIIATGADEVRRVELTDGSTVRLMANTRLAYASEDFDRAVALEAGRAFFDVTSSAEPFIVETPTARATVLGTSFGVVVEPEETEVVLASGRVEVANRTEPDRSVALQPGQTSRVGRNTAPTEPEPVDVADALAWTQLFLFRNAPIETIANQLAQHYQTSVTVAPDLRGQGVTGTFEHEQSLREILDAIATTLGAQVEPTETGYRLQPHDAE